MADLPWSDPDCDVMASVAAAVERARDGAWVVPPPFKVHLTPGQRASIAQMDGGPEILEEMDRD